MAYFSETKQRPSRLLFALHQWAGYATLVVSIGFIAALTVAL
jgi:hypothetical protein